MFSKHAYENAAKQFIEDFPIGSKLMPSDLDAWAGKHGLLNPPPPGTPKQSDAWLAHLQRRHQFRWHLNKAAIRPLVSPEEDRAPYTVDLVGTNMLEVRTPALAVSHNLIARRIGSLTVTKRKQLHVLMKSADWNVLDQTKRMFAFSLARNIERFAARTIEDSRWLNNEFTQLAAEIRHAVDSGEVKPINHGISGILAEQVDLPFTEEPPRDFTTGPDDDGGGDGEAATA